MSKEYKIRLLISSCKISIQPEVLSLLMTVKQIDKKSKLKSFADSVVRKRESISHQIIIYDFIAMCLNVLTLPNCLVELIWNFVGSASEVVI